MALILIVDDSLFQRKTITSMLEKEGHDVIQAEGGLEGIELAIEKKPDLILLDIRLPDIDGYEVYRRIRETDWGKKAKVVVLTASESIDNISKNIDLPKEFILFKPEWAASDLMEKIENVLKD